MNQYPDYRTEDTMVITKVLDNTSWEMLRAEVEKKYGRIFEDVLSQAEAEIFNKAIFRVAKPRLGGNYGVD